MQQLGTYIGHYTTLYRYGGLWKNHHKPLSGRNKVPTAATEQASLAAVDQRNDDEAGIQPEQPCNDEQQHEQEHEQKPTAAGLQDMLLHEAQLCTSDSESL